MKELFDVSMREHQKMIEAEKAKMREAFAYVVKEGDTKVGKVDMEFFMQRVGKIEKLMSQLQFE